MTVNEAIAALNASTLPAFSGYSTPVRTNRSGNDQSGDFEAEYGPSAGPNGFGLPVPSIWVRVDWVNGRVTRIAAHNTELTYEKVLSIVVSSYGKPDVTSDDDPDPDGVVARYAQWSRSANIATDVLQIMQYKTDAKHKAIITLEVQRSSTRLYQSELKAKAEWSSNLRAAASDPNPALAYWKLCATQYNAGNQTRAAIACDKAIAGDPGRADAYYIKANLIISTTDAGNALFRITPETEALLKKYLELAPNGGHADEVRQMLEMAAK
jgi:hypothetical protein